MTEENDLVLERMLDAPRDLVWKAWTDPNISSSGLHPGPIETPEIELDLKPGGIFYIRMTGPDGFDTGTATGCVLEVIERREDRSGPARSARLPPKRHRARAAARFPLTAIITFADAGNGKTHYKAVSLAQDAADKRSPREDGLPRRLGHGCRPARGICEGSSRYRVSCGNEMRRSSRESGASFAGERAA